MRVSVFGLGYVGAVTAACLARDGHQVIGVDVNADKVKMINDGRSPVVEEGVEELIAAGRDAGRLTATDDTTDAVAATDVSLISVGTPSRANGSLDTGAVERVAQAIGTAIGAKAGAHTVVVRSTVLPGTVRELVVPALAGASGREPGAELGVCFNPEFLREGSSIRDYDQPPFTLIGQLDAAAGDVVAGLYDGVQAEVIRTSIEAAEMVKYVSNAWHALKVVFGNEIGRMAHALGVDSHAVMDVFCRDDKLNLSARYLKPGFAFGGSCLPKDLRALLYRAKELDVEMPMLEAILPSNDRQVQQAIDRVLATGQRRVGILGLSFKAGTDDLRESPLVRLVETLLGKGCDLRIYDRNVSLARLVGANRAYIEHEIPHIAELMAPSIDDVLDHGDVIVIGNPSPEFADVPSRCAGKTVIDLVRILDDPGTAPEGYEGLSW